MARAALTVLVAMTAFESLKQLILPDITLWQSHLATITFAIITTASVGYFAVRRFADLQGQLHNASAELSRLAEHERLQARAQMQHVLVSSPAVIYSLKVEHGQIVAVWNTENVTQLTGYPREETLSPEWWSSHVHPEDGRRLPDLPAMLQQDRMVDEYRFRHANGAYLWIRNERRVLRDALGQPTELIGSWADITERKQVEEALQHSEHRFRALIEKSRDLVAIIDRNGAYQYVNPAHETVSGFKSKDLLGTQAFDLLHPDDVSELVPKLTEAIQLGVASATVEYRLRHHDGSWRNFEGMALNLLDDPSVAGFLITGRDITERKRAEQRNALLLQCSQDMSTIHDLDELQLCVQQRLAAALPCNGGFTSNWRSQDQRVRIIGDFGIADELRDEIHALRFPLGALFGGRIGHGGTLIMNDMQEASPSLARLAARLGIAALMATPLQIRGTRHGALVVFRTTAGQPFNTEQADLLRAVAAQLVAAIESIELQRQLQEEAFVNGALARVSQELSASLSTSSVLDRLCRITAEVLECETSYTLLRVPHEDVYAVAAAAIDPALHDEALALRLPGAALQGMVEVLSQQAAWQVDMASPPTAWAAIPKRYGLTRALYVPLRRHGEIIGFHCAGIVGRQARFSPIQERLAVGIARIASVALENARLVEALERADQVKSDFVATMSHELRTPLNIIMGYTDLLIGEEFGPLNDEQKETLQRSLKSSQDLLILVNTTLDLSRLETQESKLDTSEVDVPHLLRQLASETRVLERSTGLKWEWCIPEELPPVRTDALKLKAVLNNLLSNAAKFTEKGSVTVEARERDGGVEISVIDTGIGIAPEAHGIIFEAFRQADSTTTRRQGGVGLGLHIARRLIDALGGTISIESKLGQGATFRVWLPSSKPAPPTPLQGRDEHL